MISNGRYYGELDVFIEKPETAVLTDDVAVVDANGAVDGDEFDAEQQDDEDDGDHEEEESEDEYQASDASDHEEGFQMQFKS